MKWRVIELHENDAFFHMAMDEAVSEAVAQNKSPPTIRFWTWKPSAVSIGYFQSLKDEVDDSKTKELGVDIVRRRTGGGAVYHDNLGEITYSIIAPENMFPKNIIESYKEICGYLINAFDSLGIKSEFRPINDIIVNGKKISGNAQTRRNKILLQHGTILYTVDWEKMFSMLKVGKEKMSDKVMQHVKDLVTSVKDVNPDITQKQLFEALKNSFTQGKEFETGSWTEEELTRAKQLAEEKYSTKEWNYKK